MLALRKAREEAADTERKLRLLWSGVREALLELDDRGRVRDCNRAAEALLGRNRLQICGMRLWELLTPIGEEKEGDDPRERMISAHSIGGELAVAARVVMFETGEGRRALVFLTPN